MTAAFKAIYDADGIKPAVVVSKEFSGVLDGTSYVEAHVLPVHWYQGMPVARAYAEARWGGSTAVQWWQEKAPIPAEFRGPTVLQSHAMQWGISLDRWPHYGASMMERAGFSWDEALQLRPVFDRRNPAREAALLAQHYPLKMRSKPLLLLALDGQSSPWGHQPEFFRELGHAFRAFHVVDLSKFKAHRVFDILALLENAAGLITVDSLFLHLASACDVPYACFTQNFWTGSVPKANCRLEIKYSQSLQRMHEILPHLARWSASHANSPLLQQLLPA